MVALVDQWNEQACLKPKAEKKKQRHLADGSVFENAARFTTSYPFVMMFTDLVKGAYRIASQLSPGRPSPSALLIGDNHFTNCGSEPSRAGSLVYAVIDWTKVGKGLIEDDAKRLAATSVMAARENKLSPAQQRAVARAVADGYFDELVALAGSEQKPNAFLSQDELDPQSPIAALLEAAQKKSAADDGGTLLDSSGEFKKKFSLKKGSPDWNKVAAAYEEYSRSIDSGAGKAFRPLSFAARASVGGSNSGLLHYYVLVEMLRPGKDSKRRLIEMKQLIPAPMDTASGSPTAVDGAQAVADAKIISPHAGTYLGQVSIDGVSHAVDLMNGREQLLDLGKISAPQLALAGKETGRLTARVHLQSVDRAALRLWLSGLNVEDAKERLVAFGTVYPLQAEQDVAALGVTVKKKKP